MPFFLLVILGVDYCLKFGIYKLKKAIEIEKIEEQNCAFQAPKESINSSIVL
jgi:hypothetical protein